MAIYETNEIRTATAVPALVVLTGASAVMTVVCITNPKACFGSCPTFYTSDGDVWHLRAEGFSSSVAPCLEATDTDALYDAALDDSVFAVRMRNEALETHVVRSVDLLLVPRPDGGRAFHIGGGEFVQAQRLLSPRQARGREGDCLAELRFFDGRERCSPADSLDLAARETIELKFPQTEGARLGLVISARQSLVTTYLFYQTLAYMGSQAGWWLASLERGGPGAEEVGGALGRIEVEQEASDGRWLRCGSFGETGPLATDVGLVPLRDDSHGPVRLRLSLARGCWRIDGVALAELGEVARPIRLRPLRVLRSGQPDEPARQTLVDSTRTLLTVPGDEYELEYRLPPHAGRYEVFLQSRGYYLEWMRDDWLREEDQAKAAGMLLDSKRALRDLAPDFKAQEATMEAAFWGSRFERGRGHDRAIPQEKPFRCGLRGLSRTPPPGRRLRVELCAQGMARTAGFGPDLPLWRLGRSPLRRGPGRSEDARGVDRGRGGQPAPPVRERVCQRRTADDRPGQADRLPG